MTLTAPSGVVGILLMGLGFQLGGGVMMGPNRFAWVFAASYPAVLFTNAESAVGSGAPAADLVTLTLLGLGAIGLLASGSRPVLLRSRGSALRLTDLTAWH